MFIRVGAPATKFLGIPRSTQYSMIKEGTLPKPLRLNDRKQGWHIDVISAFLKGETDVDGKAIKGGAA